MNNHIHLIWQLQEGYTREKVQLSFLRYTAQQIKFDLQKNNPKLLENFKVNTTDRQYQFWERNALSVELTAEKYFWQKLNYIHQNPVKEVLCKYEEEYFHSSAKFYETGKDNFGFLTHYRD